jgi:hypothetical protein
MKKVIGFLFAAALIIAGAQALRRHRIDPKKARGDAEREAQMDLLTGAAETRRAARVEVTISTEAGKLLEEHGMTIAGGILRKVGSKGGYDLAAGSGALYVLIHPQHKDALAVALADHGHRYAEIEIHWLGLLPPGAPAGDQIDAEDEPMISPLGLPERMVAKLFPNAPPQYTPAVSASIHPPGGSPRKPKKGSDSIFLPRVDF